MSSREFKNDSKSEFELHPNRLSTTDSEGRRLFIHTADVRGSFRTQRSRVQFVLILTFLLLPWLKINGQQALLLNITERDFEIFGLSLRAHNAPLLFFVLAGAAFGLFFTTALFGRVWCGWACPQTVFVDGVFRKIERWVEGSAQHRRALDQSPMSFEKLCKKLLKWILFIGITLVLTHSFLAYFVGTESLAKMIQRNPSENWGSFSFMLFSSLLLLFNFAWFREQFCTIVCPYGRFQSVLMDKNSMLVAYDAKRGEPRSTPQAKILSKLHGSQLGDCVNCYRCVQVCPTGIDIRRGLQMECIACTSCIDACDEVMQKLNKAPGLIRYNSSQLFRRIPLRSIFYLSICLLSFVSLIFALQSAQAIDIEVLRAKDQPYTVQTMPNGEVIVTNHFKLNLSNQSGTNQDLVFSFAESESKSLQLIMAQPSIQVSNRSTGHLDVFIRFPKILLSNGQRNLELLIQDKNQSDKQNVKIKKELQLVGPFS